MALRCLRSFSQNRIVKTLLTQRVTSKKYFLSVAYGCQDVWDQREKNSVLEKLNGYDFATKLKEKLDKEGMITAIDVDIMVNKLDDMDTVELDFVEDLLNRFRHTKEAIHIMESTPYALIRSFLKSGETERLLKMLQNKIHYGIFLDYYTANMLLDYFLEHQLYQDAAQIAYDLMLQEDFAHPITKNLSFYACHRRLQEMPKEEEILEPEKDEEEIKYRKVQYIENPWYDDHFDIPKESMKLGKTLIMLTNSDDVLNRGYKMIGFGLYEKFNEALELLQRWIESDIKQVISQTQLDRFKSILDNLKTQKPPSAKDPGLMTISDLYPFVTDEQKTEYLLRFQNLQSRLLASGKVVDNFDAENGLKKLVIQAIKQFEGKDIEDQTCLFKKWETDRKSKLEEQIENYKIQQKKKEIARRLLDLTAKDEKLHYFEQKAKIDLQLSLNPQFQYVEEVTDEEQFVAPPGERKTSADVMKKKKS